MADEVIIERDRDGDGGTGSSAVWAIALIIIAAIIAGAVYYSGVLNQKPAEKKVNIEVKAP